MVSILDFTRFPLAVNFAVFALAAGIVWLAGTRIARYADRISRQTGLGGVVVGLLLLGGVTADGRGFTRGADRVFRRCIHAVSHRIADA